MSVLFNPYQRFTKNELNQKGFKLAFVDNNFLSYLTKIIDQPVVKKQVFEAFEFNKIRPVLNNFVFYEFIKGLKPSLPEHDNLITKKRYVAQFLDELKAIWILNHVNILAFELLHTYEKIKKNSHEFYNIYSLCPLDIMGNSKPFSVKGSASYPCDKVMPFRYSPYSDSTDSLTNPVSTWLEYFEHNIKDLGELGSIESILEDFLKNEEVAFQEKKELSKAKEIIYQKRIKHIIAPLIGCHYLKHSHELYIVEAVKKIYDSMALDFSISSVLDYAPLYSIYNHFYWDTLKNWDIRKRKDKKLRDILDRLHAYVALSYCDYFITKDSAIKQKSSAIIQKLNLQSLVLEYNINPFNFR